MIRAAAPGSSGSAALDCAPVTLGARSAMTSACHFGVSLSSVPTSRLGCPDAISRSIGAEFEHGVVERGADDRPAVARVVLAPVPWIASPLPREQVAPAPHVP